jgi:quinol monooxygenase YgiN
MMLLLVDITTVPGKREEFIVHLHELLGGGAEGLLQYSIGTTPSEPETIALVEEWHDEAAHLAFMQTETFATFRSATSGLGVGPPKARQFTIDVPRAPETPIISLL